MKSSVFHPASLSLSHVQTFNVMLRPALVSPINCNIGRELSLLTSTNVYLLTAISCSVTDMTVTLLDVNDNAPQWILNKFIIGQSTPTLISHDKSCDSQTPSILPIFQV